MNSYNSFHRDGETSNKEERGSREIPLKERIIFALDFPEAKEALEWVERLEGVLGFYKVGLQLFLAGGWPLIEAIEARGHKVMLDLKFFDIPATVAKAVQQLNGRGITFATIHGNEPMLEAAVAAKDDVRLLAVTVLTSFDESDLRALGMTGSVEELVTRRAQRAIELGCDGIVASAREARMLRQRLGDGFTIVTPGIRPATDSNGSRDDQKRVTTAKEAIENGADYLVIGRPIAQSTDPEETVERLKAEILEGLSNRT